MYIPLRCTARTRKCHTVLYEDGALWTCIGFYQVTFKWKWIIQQCREYSINKMFTFAVALLFWTEGDKMSRAISTEFAKSMKYTLAEIFPTDVAVNFGLSEKSNECVKSV